MILWDADAGGILDRIDVPAGMSSPAFLPDGQRVLIAPWHEEPAVFVWDPCPKRAIGFACTAAGRDLTEDEWQATFGDERYESTCPVT